MEIISIEIIIFFSIIILSYLVVFAYVLVEDKAILQEEIERFEKTGEEISRKSESLTNTL